MIRFINCENRHHFVETMDQLFRVRREVFVDERGWREFDTGLHERDCYDDDDASYVVALDKDGCAAGCFRLYPTTLPHMLSESFAFTVDGPVIRRSDVMEMTRFHLRKDWRHREAYLELMAAIPEIGLELGLTGIAALVQTLRIPVMRATGLSVKPLGLPQIIDGLSHTAILLEVDQQALDRVNATRGVTASVFEHNKGGMAA